MDEVLPINNEITTYWKSELYVKYASIIYHKIFKFYFTNAAGDSYRTCKFNKISQINFMFNSHSIIVM